jgi:hypothetical protein
VSAGYVLAETAAASALRARGCPLLAARITIKVGLSFPSAMGFRFATAPIALASRQVQRPNSPGVSIAESDDLDRSDAAVRGTR